jgi:hypothetical protein
VLHAFLACPVASVGAAHAAVALLLVQLLWLLPLRRTQLSAWLFLAAVADAPVAAAAKLLLLLLVAQAAASLRLAA